MSYTDEFLNEMGNKVTVNMPSVIKLGYGPISAKRLYELVESGRVTVEKKDNELFFSKM